jgi:hypothetical protein
MITAKNTIEAQNKVAKRQASKETVICLQDRHFSILVSMAATSGKLDLYPWPVITDIFKRHGEPVDSHTNHLVSIELARAKQRIARGLTLGQLEPHALSSNIMQHTLANPKRTPTKKGSGGTSAS